MPHVFVDSVVVSENFSTAVITFRLSEALGVSASINYGTSAGSATVTGGNPDYVSKNSPPVTFAPGETLKTLEISLINDGAIEFNEWFFLSLTLPGGSPLTLDRSRILINLLDNDTTTSTPSISIGDAITDELSGRVTFIVTLDRAPTGTVTVDYATSDVTAQAGTDYTTTTGTLSFSAGTRVQTITVPVTDDLVREGFEQFLVTLSSPTGGATIAGAVGTGIIGPSDATPVAKPVVMVSDAVVAEGDAYAEFILWLDAPSNDPVTLSYLFLNGSTVSTADADYDSGISGDITFAPGQMTHTVRVPITDDAAPVPPAPLELPETFWMTLSVKSGSVATLGRATAFGVIVDNDAPAGVPIVSVRGGTFDETQGMASFVVTLDKPSATEVFVPWLTVDATALAASDYVARAGTLGFAPGEMVKTVIVPLIDDAVPETAEYFRFELGAPVNASIGVGTADATIGASDAPAVVKPTLFVDPVTISEYDTYVELVLRLDAPANVPLTASFNFLDGAATKTGDADYIDIARGLWFAPGQTVQTVRIPITNDTVLERVEDFRMTVTGTDFTRARAEIPITIVDNDATALVGPPIVAAHNLAVDEHTGQFARFVVTLDRPSAQVVSVQYTTVDGTAIAAQDFVARTGTLSFEPGDTAQTVIVPILDDVLAERAEQFSLQLSAPAGASIGVAQGVATIAANDAPVKASPTLFVDDVTVSEFDGHAHLVFRLDAPSAIPIPIDFHLTEGFADWHGSVDFIHLNERIVFAPGQTVHTVSIPITDDDVFEPTETFWIRVPASGLTGVALSRDEIPVVIVDNDRAFAPGHLPTVSVRDVAVDEATGEFARFVVVLDHPSASPVSVNFATADITALAGSDYLQASGTLVFMPGDTVRTVEVKLIDDAIAEAAEQFSLSLDTPNGVVLGDAKAVATIAANDAPVSAKPTLYVDDVVVGEGDAFVEFVLRLDAPSNSPIAVNYQTPAGTAFASSADRSDFITVNSDVTFAPGQTLHTVRVPITDDDTGFSEPLEAFWLSLNVKSGSSAALARTLATALIVENDLPAAAPAGAPRASVLDTVVDETAGYATFYVRLDRPPVSTVSLDYSTVDRTALAGSDYLATAGNLVFEAGEMVKSVQVLLIDDALAERAEQFVLEIASTDGIDIVGSQGRATIGASDGPRVAVPSLLVRDVVVGESDGLAHFVFSLDAPSNSPVTFNYSFGNAGASSEDYASRGGSVTFAPGATTAVVGVPIDGDIAIEGAESFEIRLSVASGSNASLARSEAIATIFDDDPAPSGATPAVSIGDVVINESEGIAIFDVRLDQPSSSVVSVAFDTADGTALDGRDYRALSGTLNFLPGQTVGTVQVAIVDDGTWEVDERFSVLLSSPVNATLGDRVGTALIARNDVNPVANPTIGGSHLLVPEYDGFAQFVVTLSAPATTPIKVIYSSQSSLVNDFIPVIANLEFAPGQTALPVRVALVQDTLVEPDEVFNLNLSRGTGSQGTIGNSPLVATIVDDDGGVPVMSYGMGDDIYRVTAANTRILELPGGGTDTVETALNNYTLPENVENLLMLGGANLAGTGNALNNTFQGNSGNNTFNGGAGFDVVVFGGSVGNYAFTLGASIVAQDLLGTDGTDTLNSIEAGWFPGGIGLIEVEDVLAGRDNLTVFVDSATGQARYTGSVPEREAWRADPGVVELTYPFAIFAPLGGIFSAPGTIPVYRFFDPVGDQYIWTSDGARKDDWLATRPQLWFDGEVTRGHATQAAALAAGGLGLGVNTFERAGSGDVGEFALHTVDAAVALVAQGYVDYGTAFWV